MTWLIFNIYGLEFDFIASFTAGFMSLIPLVSPFMIIIPVSIKYYIQNEIIKAISIFVKF